MNIRIKNSLLVLFVALLSNVVNFLLQLGWDEFVIFDRSFPVLWGVIPTLIILSWMPVFVVFGVGGYITAKVVKSNNMIWSTLMGIIGAAIFFLLTNRSFSEHASMIHIIWSYLGFLVPLISSVFGGFIYNVMCKRQIVPART